jgi:hypothetical protein
LFLYFCWGEGEEQGHVMVAKLCFLLVKKKKKKKKKKKGL